MLGDWLVPTKLLAAYACACGGYNECSQCVNGVAYGWAEARLTGQPPELRLIVRQSLPPGRSQLLHRLFSPEPLLQGEIEALQAGSPVTGQGQVEGPPVKPRG